jgi:hypothetical protein
MEGHAYNPRTWEVEVGVLWVQGQPDLHCETLCQKKTNQVGRGNKGDDGEGEFNYDIFYRYHNVNPEQQF